MRNNIRFTRSLAAVIAFLVLLPAHAAPPLNADRDKASAAFEDGRYDEAVVEYQRLLHESPDNKQYRMRLAKSYEITGRPQKAEQHADVVLSRDARNVDALLLKGRMSGRRQDWSSAKSYYEKAVKEDRVNPDAYLGLGQAYMALGDSKSADGAFSMYRKLTDSN